MGSFPAIFLPLLLQKHYFWYLVSGGFQSELSQVSFPNPWDFFPSSSTSPHAFQLDTNSFLKYADGSYGNHGDRAGGKERQRQAAERPIMIATDRQREYLGSDWTETFKQHGKIMSLSKTECKEMQ